jgi:tetratricopeptide (TPR) repeat protein
MFVRCLSVGLAVFLAVTAWILGPDLFKLGWKSLPIEFRYRLPFLFLEALLVAYPVALFGAIGLIATALRSSRRIPGQVPGGRRRAVRLLAAGASILFSLLVLDVGAAVWRSWRERMPDLPGVLPTQFRPGVNGVEGSTEAPAPAAFPRLQGRFADDRSQAALRVLVIGESSAEGQPYNPWLSIAHIAAWKLESVFPGRSAEVDMWAYGGATLWDMHNRLAGLKYRPDALLLYAGHNEFQSRFAWQREPGNYYFDERPRPYSPATLASLLRFSPLCRLVLETWERQSVSLRPPRRVTRKLIDQPTCTPEEHAAILDDFARRLESIAAYCEAIGTLAIFVVPACNDGDYDPNRSALDPATPRAEREAFERQFERARAAEAPAPAEALRLYRDLVARHPEFADAQYRLARLLEQAGEYREAREHYILARDDDRMPHRCQEDFRRAYRDVAARHPSLLLVDGPRVLEAASEHGILDDRLFSDAHHPNLIGYVALSQDLLNQLRARRAFGWPADAPTPSVDVDDCARHFGMDANRWDEICKRSWAWFNTVAYIRYDPTFRLERAETFRRASEAIESGSDPADAGLPGWDRHRVPSTSPRYRPREPVEKSNDEPDAAVGASPVPVPSGSVNRRG